VDGTFLVATVGSAIAVLMLVRRGVQVSRWTRRLREEGRPVPRSVTVFRVLAVVSLVLVAGAWILWLV